MMQRRLFDPWSLGFRVAHQSSPDRREVGRGGMWTFTLRPVDTRLLDAVLKDYMPTELAHAISDDSLGCRYPLLHELKAAREAKGLSLADLTKLTGMDRSALSKLENGQRGNPTLGTLSRYAEAVGKRLMVSLVDE